MKQEGKPTIGFIGQGFVGKSYADDFENRGYTVVRYALEKPYIKNKANIQKCDIVFIAVPTPTTPGGFDYSIVEESLKLVGKNKTAVIKSTLLPGTSDRLQEKHPELVVLFSPEFLLAKSAANDARKPIMNIIGVTKDTAEQQKTARHVLAQLSKSSHEQICKAREAELFKYVHNLHGYFRVLFANIMYDAAQALNCDWEEIKEAMEHDPYLSERANYYNNPVHKSGHPGAKPGRGAGGPCYIKDMAAFSDFYAKVVKDKKGTAILEALEQKNIELLRKSEKDADLLKGVYGYV